MFDTQRSKRSVLFSGVEASTEECSLQLSGCYSKFNSENAENQLEVFLEDCHRVFGSSQDWKLRQAYVNLCQSIDELQGDTPDQYALRFLGVLLSLKEDHVVNVRLSLGTFLYQHLVHNGSSVSSVEQRRKAFDLDFYAGLSDDWRSQLDECLQMLLVDRDRDVRASVGGVYDARGTPLPNESNIEQSDMCTDDPSGNLGDQLFNQS